MTTEHRESRLANDGAAAGPRTARVARLVAYLLDGVVPLAGEALDSEFCGWFSASRRFTAFAEEHRDKIRKKLRTASEPDARGDVRRELETAFLLLADRRISLAFEAYGAGRRGPDFTVTFRTAHRFNLEVTRPRARVVDHGGEAAIANALLAKLRQLPADAPNALLIATGLAASVEDVAAAVRSLKSRADRGDDEYFAERGVTGREFRLLYRRVALLLVGSAVGPGVLAWTNPEARRPLPTGARAVCLACFANARWEASPAKPEE